MNVRIGSRHEFTAIVLCWNSQHICLENICFDTIERQEFRNHLWLVYCRKWKRLELKQGDIVRFSGKVNQYHHWNRQQLEITNIREITKVENS